LKVVSRLHFALGEGWIAVLGTAETLRAPAALFRPVDLRRRIYARSPSEQRGPTPKALGLHADSEPPAMQRAAVVLLDGALRVRAWSAPCEELFRVSAREALGRPIFEVETGLPEGRARPLILEGLAGEAGAESAHPLVFEVPRRRGDAIRCKVTCSGAAALGEGRAAVLVIEPIEATR
jgi:hypothetical protein